jgi:hypothetical protein
MVNKPEDIHSLLAFLEVQPLCQADLFNDLVVAPIRERHSSGLDVLRAVMSFVCLRRKKQSLMENIQLVSKTGKPSVCVYPWREAMKRLITPFLALRRSRDSTRRIPYGQRTQEYVRHPL